MTIWRFATPQTHQVPQAVVSSNLIAISIALVMSVKPYSYPYRFSNTNDLSNTFEDPKTAVWLLWYNQNTIWIGLERSIPPKPSPSKHPSERWSSIFEINDNLKVPLDICSIDADCFTHIDISLRFDQRYNIWGMINWLISGLSTDNAWFLFHPGILLQPWLYVPRGFAPFQWFCSPMPSFW